MDLFVIGGDKRQLYAAQLLMQQGFDVTATGFERASDCENIAKADLIELDGKIVLLPIPYKDREGYIKMPYSDEAVYLIDIAHQLQKSKLVLLGKADSEAKGIFAELNIPYVDLMNDEAFTVRNAHLTAQAAVLCAGTRMEAAWSDVTILINGYGRITRALIGILKAFGATVVVSTRKPEHAEWIRTLGAAPILTKDLFGVLPAVDVIFNTAPAKVFKSALVSELKKDALYFELASAPYGIDMEAAAAFGKKVFIEPSLPGRYFPLSAAGAVADAVMRAVKGGEVG